jgi:hypothetical protein
VFSVEHVGTTIVYAKNGEAFRVVTGVSSALSLALDSSFLNTGAEANSIIYAPNITVPVWFSEAEQDGSGTTFGSWTQPSRELDPETQNRVQNLTPGGRILSTNATLNSNNNFGLRALSQPPGMTATVQSTTCTVAFDATGQLASDLGTVLSLPSASFPGLAFTTTYYFYRNMATPNALGNTNGSYGATTDLQNALSPTKIYVGLYTTRA